jgi:hypothetical protein
MVERTTVRLPEELMRRAKRKAAAEGISLTALIGKSLRQVLHDKGSPQTPARALPPISSARGGLLPGIDLNDTAALEEMDDLERCRSGA